MNEANAKQQIVDTLKNADTILVTVSTNPSVDELSAALGLTIFLNDMNKHATAVVSGSIPPAISFLEPDKTFEDTVDSLRDFVIALDKEKADHLRYKVEGDVVKIFITPYKTVIGKDDLDFSQGDYNVEMVIALGVTDQDHLDKALAAHGRILHDASVATIGVEPSSLGSMDWTDTEASSLSEMITALIDAVKTDEKVSEQVASALLTGIVAATDRFSNEKTSSRTMTMSAQLMAAGANQQLIASKLREGSKLPLDEQGSDISQKKNEKKDSSNSKPQKQTGKGGLTIKHDKSNQPEQQNKTTEDKVPQEKSKQGDNSTKAPEVPAPKEPAPKLEEKAKVETHSDVPKPKDGEDYNPEAALDAALKKSSEREAQEKEAATEQLVKELEDQAKSQEEAFAQKLETVAPLQPPAPVLDEKEVLNDLKQQSEEPSLPPLTPPAERPTEVNSTDTPDVISQTGRTEPSLGGVLNATTEQAAADKRLAEAEDRNKTILTHGNAGASNSYATERPDFSNSPFNGAGMTGEPPSVDPFKDLTPAAETATEATIQPFEGTPHGAVPSATLAEIDKQNRRATLGQGSSEPLMAPLPPAPDFSQLPPLPPQMPEVPQGGLPPLPQPPTGEMPPLPGAQVLPPPPPMPDFASANQLPPLPPQMPEAPHGLPQLPQQPMEPMPPQMPMEPLPPENLGETLPPAAASLPPQPADPKQFKIPGQP